MMTASKDGTNPASFVLTSLTNQSISCDAMEQIPENDLQATQCHMSGDTLVCCAGQSLSNGNPFDKCWKYDVGANTWTMMPAQFADMRYAGAIVDLEDGTLWYTGTYIWG